MTLHQLRLFAAVAQYRNVTNASYELHISQPAVSRQLKLLEVECGVKLYGVNGRGIELTTDGRLFLDEVKPFLAQFEKLKIFKRRVNPAQETFTIGASTTPSASFLPSLLSLFKNRHPGVHTVLRTSTSHAVERMILTSEVEAGFVTAPSHLPMLAYEPFYEDELVVFMSRKHRLARREQLSIEELAAAPLIIKRGPQCHAEFFACLSRLGLKPNIVMECEFPQIVLAAVRTCMGLGMLYRQVLKSELSDGSLKLMKISKLKLRGAVYAVFNRSKPLSRHVSDLFNLASVRTGEEQHFELPSLPAAKNM